MVKKSWIKTYIFLMGDFNFPTITWREDNIISRITYKEHNQPESLLDLVKMLFMEQIILSPTTIDSILDLFHQQCRSYPQCEDITDNVFKQHDGTDSVWFKSN